MNKGSYIKIFQVVFLSILFFSPGASGQYLSPRVDTKWGSLEIDKSLSNILFATSTMFRDSTYLENGDTDDFNVPIRSNIYASGACYPDTLLFCLGYIVNDTINIGITAPSMCCMDYLTLRIYKKNFTSYFYYSYDVAPDAVLMKPIKQVLVLRNIEYKKGDTLQGYINFIGSGIDTSTVNRTILTESGDNTLKNIKRIDTVNAKGYFKCILK